MTVPRQCCKYADASLNNYDEKTIPVYKQYYPYIINTMIPFCAPLFTFFGDFNQETDCYIDFVGAAILVCWTSIIQTQHRRRTWINAPVVISGF